MRVEPFEIQITTGENKALVTVLRGKHTVASFLFRGMRCVSALVENPRERLRFVAAGRSLLEAGACGGRFDF